LKEKFAIVLMSSIAEYYIFYFIIDSIYYVIDSVYYVIDSMYYVVDSIQYA